MTIHVQSSASTPLPTPVAIADFRNGVYSIGGISKTFAQMFVKGNPDDPDPVVVPGQGLQVVSTSAAQIITNFLVSTPALFAAVTHEFVGVAEFTASTTGDPLVNDMTLTIATTDEPDEVEGWAWSYETASPYTWDVIEDYTGVYGDTQALVPPYQGHFKNAYMFCEEELAASMNGAAARVPTGTPQANAAANSILINIRAWSADDVSTTSMTLEALHFYAELTTDVLRMLSAV